METSKKEIVIKKANDHWAFLELIEAPMWVDLTLEAQSGGEDTNDEWFSVSHPFHQWSSHQLKSKFSNPGEEVVTSGLDTQGPPSPELPSSVSRSRGKHYKTKKWGGNNLDILFDKQLPARGLSRRCFQAGSSFGLEVKSKSNLIRSKGISSAKLGLVFERNASGNALSICTKPMATGRSLVISSGSTDNKTGESNSRSTITSEYTQQQQNFMEVSSKPYGQKSQPSFRNTTSLRKSCVVKKAFRVDIGSDSRQSRGRKSSSGKSSVGSCSNPVYEVKSASKQQRGKISAGKDVAIVNLAAKNRCKLSNVSRTSRVQVEEPKLSNGMGTTINFAKATYHKAAKSLVQHQTVRLRALSPANKPNSSTSATEKLENGRLNGLAGKNKEHAASYVAVHQKGSERGVPAVGLSIDQRTTEPNILRKGNRAGLAALQGKVTRGARNTTNLSRRIYLLCIYFR